MRDKRRTMRRPTAVDPSAPGSRPGTADWILVNEAGWGFPHGGVVILAGIVAGARALGYLIWRLAAAVDRAVRRGRRPPGRRRG